jgi:branched-chain amino acid transport system permease protein
MVVICIFTVLAESLALVSGEAGVLSVAHGAFFGIGAYATALGSVTAHWPFLAGPAVGVLIAAAVAIVISIPSLRVRGDYFVILTFGFQIILSNTFAGWFSLTRGPLGIPGIPRPTILGWTPVSSTDFLLPVLVLAVAVHIVFLRVRRSPFGRVLRAIRGDEDLAEALGKNTLRFKVTTFALSAGLAALAGTAYAYYFTFVDPTAFTFTQSILVVSMVIVGGAGSAYGPSIGAVILVLLPEALRFVGLPSAVAAEVQQVLYGVVLVSVLVYRPRGLVGQYAVGR